MLLGLIAISTQPMQAMADLSAQTDAINNPSSSATPTPAPATAAIPTSRAIATPTPISEQYQLRAMVKVNGVNCELSKPFYICDFYPGATRPSQYKPNDKYPLHKIGPCTAQNFGDPNTIRERLLVFKSYGVYPAIHIFPMLNNSSGNITRFPLVYNGQLKLAYQQYNDVYKPVLEELKIPHLILIDFWLTDYDPMPSYLTTDQKRERWWHILEDTITNIDTRSDLLIKFKYYNSDDDDWHPGIYFYQETHAERTDGLLRLQLFEACGQPGATGKNPYNGHDLHLGDYFWIMWNTFVPSQRDHIPGGNEHGVWNIVNCDQVNAWEANFTTGNSSAFWQTALIRHATNDSYYRNAGPNYFPGYINHLISNGYHEYIPEADEKEFLSSSLSVNAGMISIGVWDEYAESMVFEPSVNINVSDPHIAWQGCRPLFIERFWNFRTNKFSEPAALDIAPNGWFKTYYYNNKNCSGKPVLIRYEKTVDYSFGAGDPGFGVNSNGFSILWDGMMNFPTAGTYTFTANHDEGARVEVMNKMIIDQWGSVGTHSSAVAVNQGWQHVRIWYYHETGAATIKVSWQ
jgi:hypothetical protein